MFRCLYYSVAINESKEKLRIVFCCFPTTKNTVVPSSSNFHSKLICWEISIFFCLDKSMLIRLSYFNDTNNLKSFLLYSHCFLAFQQAFHTLFCLLFTD